MRSFWGTLIGAANLCRAARLPFKPDPKLDVVCRMFVVLVVLFFPRGVLGVIRRKAAS